MLDEPAWHYLMIMPVCKKGGKGGREGRRRIWSEESFYYDLTAESWNNGARRNSWLVGNS
jgi:hypothetical protein